MLPNFLKHTKMEAAFSGCFHLFLPRFEPHGLATSL